MKAYKFSRFFMAMLAMLFLFGPIPGKCLDTGPPFTLEVFKAMEENAQKNTEGQSSPSTDQVQKSGDQKVRYLTIPLVELPDPGETEDEFGHRFKEKYQEANLLDIIENLKIDGQLEPIQVFKTKEGKWVVIIGHRRLAALFILALREEFGFNLDMAVQCLEILGASHLELLTRSIADNELGLKLEPKELLHAVKRLLLAHCDKKRGAAALGISEKTYERYERIVRHERVFKHVMDDHLPPTTASALVEVAEKAGRLDEFLNYFAAWVQAKQDEIKEMDRRSKQERNQGLKPNQMLVLYYLEGHLVKGWLKALATGQPLIDEVDLGFLAAFDKDSAVANVKVRVDAKNAPIPHLARVASQMSQVAKHLAAFAQKRQELEGPEGPQAALRKDDSFLDLNLLKEFGLDEYAAQLEQEQRSPFEQDGGEGDKEADQSPRQ